MDNINLPIYLVLCTAIEQNVLETIEFTRMSSEFATSEFLKESPRLRYCKFVHVSFMNSHSKLIPYV